MGEKNLQLKYSLLTCPCAIFILLCQHYFYGQCQVQTIVSESLGRLEYPLLIIRFNLLATMGFLLFIILGINIQPPKKLLCFALAFWIGPLALITTFAGQSYTSSYPALVNEATDIRSFSHGVGFGSTTGTGTGTGSQRQRLGLFQQNSPNQFIKNPRDQLASFKMKKMNLSICPKKLFGLYKKLQTRFQCCGISNYSDCTGLGPGINSKLQLLKYQHDLVKPTKSGRLVLGDEAEVCQEKCLGKLSMSCVDEILNGGDNCAQAVFTVVLAGYAVFAYATIVCWCHLREMDNISIFSFGSAKKGLRKSLSSSLLPLTGLGQQGQGDIPSSVRVPETVRIDVIV